MIPLEFADSDGAFVDDLRWDVRAGVVLDIDDVWFLIAL